MYASHEKLFLLLGHRHHRVQKKPDRVAKTPLPCRMLYCVESPLEKFFDVDARQLRTAGVPPGLPPRAHGNDALSRRGKDVLQKSDKDAHLAVKVMEDQPLRYPGLMGDRLRGRAVKSPGSEKGKGRFQNGPASILPLARTRCCPFPRTPSPSRHTTY